MILTNLVGMDVDMKPSDRTADARLLGGDADLKGVMLVWMLARASAGSNMELVPLATAFDLLKAAVGDVAMVLVRWKHAMT
jgi:hypothetical protein